MKSNFIINWVLNINSKYNIEKAVKKYKLDEKKFIFKKSILKKQKFNNTIIY